MASGATRAERRGRPPPRAPWRRGLPLGTDTLGRDVFARVVHGARTALVNGLSASLALVAIGVVLGAAAGFLGGTTDALVARAVEALTAIPSLVLVVVVLATVSHAGTPTLLWTIALTRWTEVARLVRAEGARGARERLRDGRRGRSGAPPVRVLWRHVMPNVIAPALVAAAFGVASVVLLEAAVDFLQVGVPDTAPSWGESMGEARAHPGGAVPRGLPRGGAPHVPRGAEPRGRRGARRARPAPPRGHGRCADVREGEDGFSRDGTRASGARAGTDRRADRTCRAPGSTTGTSPWAATRRPGGRVALVVAHRLVRDQLEGQAGRGLGRARSA